jgi:carboxyl-terminal processing protease
VKEFTTAAGRRVYDGGGVMPDVVLPADYVSAFAVLLYGRGYIYDFVDAYMKKYPEKADPRSFRLPDEVYSEFVDFIEGKQVEYESETSKALKVLKSKAERELYSDKIGAELAALEERLKEDSRRDLQLYREQLSKIIESEIVQRQHYGRGVILHDIAGSDEIARAVELLRDRPRYDAIITSQDTQRK